MLKSPVPGQRLGHASRLTGTAELGRGAMGVTYKALDVDLRCPVTLKIISDRYLGTESARLSSLARGPHRRQRTPLKRCLGLPPGRNRRELLQCDGVCRGADVG